MKKILIIFMLSILTIFNVPTSQVDATSLSWTCGVAYSTFYVSVGTVTLMPTNDVVESVITIPWNEDVWDILRGENGGIVVELTLWDDDNVYDDISIYEDSHSQTVFAQLPSEGGYLFETPVKFVINYETLGLDNIEDYERITLQIPSTTCVVDDPLWTTFTNYANANIDYVHNYDDLSPGSIRYVYDFDYETGLSVNDVTKSTSQYIEVPTDATIMSLKTRNHFSSVTDYIEYFDSEFESLGVLWIDNDNSYDYEWFDVDVPTYVTVPLTIIQGSIYVTYNMFTEFDPYIIGSEWYYNNFSSYAFDADWVYVNYIADGDIIYDTATFTNGFAPFDDEIDLPEITGKEFSYWIDANGDVFEPNTQNITSGIAINNIANIYAIYVNESEDGSIVGPPDPTPDGGQFEIFLISMGFNDAIERIIIFALVLIGVTILCIVKGVGVFHILIIDAIILAFFMALGLLPTFVTIIIIVALLFFGYLYLMSGGGLSNE